MSAFADLRAEAKLENMIAICDKGFAKKSDQEEMERAVTLPGNVLWNVRATNAGGGWQLEPMPKAARKAIEVIGLLPPTTLPEL